MGTLESRHLRNFAAYQNPCQGFNDSLVLKTVPAGTSGSRSQSGEVQSERVLMLAALTPGDLLKETL